VYADANWGTKTDPYAKTGYLVRINNNVVSWATRKHKSVALSTAEAELYALVEGTKELMWTRQFLEELTIPLAQPHVYCDNTSAIALANYNVQHDRSKHINRRYFFVRDELQAKHMTISWVESGEQLADVLTKAVGEKHFKDMVEQIMWGSDKDSEKKKKKKKNNPEMPGRNSNHQSNIQVECEDE
jgi:hypothetical protein